MDTELADSAVDNDSDDSGSDFDSLFDERDNYLSSAIVPETLSEHVPIARREHSWASIGAQIPGIFFDPNILISSPLERFLWEETKRRYFADGTTNQIMLFDRARAPTSEGRGSSRLPQYLIDLLDAVSDLLKLAIPTDMHDLLFIGPPISSGAQPFIGDDEEPVAGGAKDVGFGRMLCARQAILNHYLPGEGISPHVDLLGRYADGIVGVSLGCGTVMDFERPLESPRLSNTATTAQEDANSAVHLYLPARSIVVMTGEARYGWSHGISKRLFDVVEDENGHISEVERGERISITFRWLLPGADVVGA